jgi:hypothetical protein
LYRADATNRVLKSIPREGLRWRPSSHAPLHLHDQRDPSCITNNAKHLRPVVLDENLPGNSLLGVRESYSKKIGIRSTAPTGDAVVNKVLDQHASVESEIPVGDSFCEIVGHGD